MDDASGHPVRVLLVEEDSGRADEVLGVLQGDARFAVRVVPASMLRLRKVVDIGPNAVDLLLVGVEGVDSLTLGLYRAAHPNSRTIGYAAPHWPGRANLASIGIRVILDWPLAIDALWTAWSAPRSVPGVGRMDQALARLQAQSSQIAQHLKRLQGAATGAPYTAPEPAAAAAPAREEDSANGAGAQQVVATSAPPDPVPLSPHEGALSAPPPLAAQVAEEAIPEAPMPPSESPVQDASPAPRPLDAVAGDESTASAFAPYEQSAAAFPDVAPPALADEEEDPGVLEHPPRQPNLISSLVQRRERQQAFFGGPDDDLISTQGDAGLYPHDPSPFGHTEPPLPLGRRDWAPHASMAPGQPPIYDYAYQNVEAARAAARAAEQAMLIAKQAVDVVQGAIANPAVRARMDAVAEDAEAPPVPHSYFRPPRPIIPVRRSDPDQGLVLAIYSPKGGTGCSTLAANLAVCLTQLGVSVALVDGHRSFGSIDVLLQLDPQGPSMLAFVDEPNIQPTHVLEALTPHASGVRSLLAPPQPEQGERVTYEIYEHVLNQLCRHFICTIIDLPADYDPCTMSIIQRADRLLVTSGPDLPALKALGRFLSYAEDLPGVLERIDLVLIRADSVPPEQVANLEERLGARFTHGVMSDGRRTTQAANRGAPFVLSAPDAPVSKDIRSIAQWLTRMHLESRARILWMDQEARLGSKR